MFDISLAQWSVHRALRSGEMTHLDFPGVAKKLGIGAVEFVNFFFEHATDRRYLDDVQAACDEAEVKSLLIMCGREGNLGDPDAAKRTQAVINHEKWVTTAWYLGCHSIRVDAKSAGTREQQRDRVVDGLGRVCQFAEPYGLDVIVENHGGLSSDGEWLSDVIKRVDRPNCGTLPDFGNFKITRDPLVEYDRYKGTDELMPFAKGVSAKSYGFDAQGNETTIDYFKMLDIVVKKHGYRGHIGIEWEGKEISEHEGIVLTHKLLERYRSTLG